MRKTAASKKAISEARMRREYRFDYLKARPNRFASRLKDKTVAVVLDADVTGIFHTSKSVNALLRSVVRALPH
jgi:hypothetical protein